MSEWCNPRGVSRQRWNSSLHAFEKLLDALPQRARCGLDVGCGEGETARRLHQRVPTVIGLDRDAQSIDEARSLDDGVEYVLGDLHTAGLPEASFDVVSAVGMLHHVDQRDGLSQLARMVRPGGTLLVVGLARSRSPLDFVRDARDSVVLRLHALTKGCWETPSPKIWPPPLTYAETRRVSLDVLPDARFTRLPYFRYGLVWSHPTGDQGAGPPNDR